MPIADPQQLFKAIKVFVLDIDGVLTDGTILLLENGVQARRMNIKDGYALQLAIKRGYRILVVSGADTSPVVMRMNKLGIMDIHMAVKDKKALIEKYASEHGLKNIEILYMGDDMPDLPALRSAGLACCPSDAVEEVKEMVHYISPFSGGNGCVRDVIEKVLKLNGHWSLESEIASR